MRKPSYLPTLLTQFILLLCLACGSTAQESANGEQSAGREPNKTEEQPRLNLNDQEATAIGARVWQNECGGRVDGLTSWNVGEDFPSLGIGHFIWYPPESRDPFEEKFPSVLRFLVAHGVTLPDWLTPETHCPWRTRTEFLNDINGKRLTELRKLLASTIALQTRFIIERLEQALPKMLAKAPPEERAAIKNRFYRMLNSGARGKFALIDYVNFKGEGINESERYNGQGWGLLQVLEEMSDDNDAVGAFSKSAVQALTRRVKNSPPQRNEAKWLPGWKNRLSRY